MGKFKGFYDGGKGELKKTRGEEPKKREKLVYIAIDEARALDDDKLGSLAVKIAGRRKVWHLVKKAIKEEALNK